MQEITFYGKCQCGAITVNVDGEQYSCTEKNFKKFFPNIDRRSLKGIMAEQKFFCCDHCVNHYGLDLCRCGSGEETGKCDCGETKSIQVLGEGTYHDPDGWL